MINLRVRTEYSFRFAYGKLADVIAKQGEYAAITDRFNTFGHIPFVQECKKQGKKAILGVELAFVEDATSKIRQTPYFATLIARNAQGLSEIYALVSKSTKQKYYFNRLSYSELGKMSNNVIIITTDSILQDYFEEQVHVFYGVSPMTSNADFLKNKLPTVAISDNLYDSQKSKELYEIVMGNGNFDDRVELSHILNEAEWIQEVRIMTLEEKIGAINLSKVIAEDWIESFDFTQAQLPKATETKSLFELCIDGIKKRKNLKWDSIYEERLQRELQLIKEKKYEDYFYLVYDLVQFAKQHMLVGCARGSSAGSLVCYLLGITDIDPIPFGLIFERFIDVNRADLPDIDIDFQDTKREMLLDYLKQKYGNDCVAKLGTISDYKPKSILTELSKVLDIPQWEIKDLKDAIIERSGGDSRASNCLEDTFTEMDIGKEFIKKYPKLQYSQFIEGHARHFGQHAAAIVVSDRPLSNYCALDYSVDGCQLNKVDAESVNLLKMDCLGLRTLSVLQDCLDLVGKDREWLVDYPLDDKKAFEVINSRKFYGIFQFEGNALISVAKQINIQEFEDISAITALARPGTLISGGTNSYIKAKNSNQINALPHCEEYTKDTFGVVIYQEQVMNIARNVGNLSWEDTSTLRKAMSRSMGIEYFNKFYEKFKQGAISQGIAEDDAFKIWSHINTMGAWAFNKSHSIAYGMISYWCMVLKAHWPLEFALATLKNAKDSEQVIQILKELVNEGYEYKPFDPELSDIDWSIKGGKLIGGFINIKGIGQKKAEKMVQKRAEGKDFSVAEKKALFNAETPFDNIFEFKTNFAEFYENWELFMKQKPMYIKDIDDKAQEVRFLAKTVSINLRDINEPILVKKRDGEIIKDNIPKFLDLKLADDTDIINCRINREIYPKFGNDIINRDKIGDHYLVQGKSLGGFRYVIIQNIKKITEQQIKEKVAKDIEKSC
jgi:DNA polymerase III alpha subunit